MCLLDIFFIEVLPQSLVLKLFWIVHLVFDAVDFFMGVNLFFYNIAYMQNILFFSLNNKFLFRKYLFMLN